MNELVEDLKIANDNLYSANKMLEIELKKSKSKIEEVREYLIKHIEEWKDVEDFTDVVEEDNYILNLLDKENK